MTDTKGCRNEEQGFIPGLPNEIVLEHIVTKLPWRSMCVLVRVSREFRRAIRSREIYNVRKRLGATQSMAVVPVSDQHLFSGFYDVESRDTCLATPVGFLQKSLADRAFEELLHGSMPQQGEDFLYWVPQQARSSDDKLDIIGNIVVLNGKLYVAIELGFNNEEEVQVLDVAACQSEWEHCSSIVICPNNEGPSDIWVACNEKFFFFHTVEPVRICKSL